MKILRVLVLIVGLSIFANAQKAILSGKVYDQAGAVISETKISLTDKQGKKFETLTNDDGIYQISIPSGTYLFEAEYLKNRAWEKFSIERYEVASATNMTLDIALRIDEAFTKKYGDEVFGKPTKNNKLKRKITKQ